MSFLQSPRGGQEGRSVQARPNVRPAGWLDEGKKPASDREDRPSNDLDIRKNVRTLGTENAVKTVRRRTQGITKDWVFFT